MSGGEYYRLTASQALQLLKSGNLTVEEYATSLLARIQQRDDEVRAWAYLNPDLILAQAKELDKVPLEKRGPLHGIAIGVKDVILTRDMPTCHNSPIYQDSAPGIIDAAPVITLRAAGALIFGKTTTTEFASTTIGPKSRNPHDITRTPGGSSSGSGAAVGDFQVPIALGTQTGGSTIRPGSYNGIYAFKPTWGAISREGLAQYSITCDTLGLYARSTEDLHLLAKIFQLADDEPVTSEPFNIKGAKVGFVKTHIWQEKVKDGRGEGLKNAWEKAKSSLETKGAIVEDISLPEDFEQITRWHKNVLDGEGRTSFLGNYLLAKDKMSQPFHDQVENTRRLSRKEQLESYDGCARLRPAWDEIAAQYDAIITPSVPDVAPIGIESTGDASFCSMWTILQVPCLNLPGFVGDQGLPIGLTLVGARYTDEHVLHAGKSIGKVFEAEGGFQSVL